MKIWLDWYENNPITDKRGHKTQNPVDVKDAEGLTALHYAARFNKFEILRLLLQYQWKPGLSILLLHVVIRQQHCGAKYGNMYAYG